MAQVFRIPMLLLLALSLWASHPFTSHATSTEPRLSVPPGFKIETFSAQLPGARSLAIGSKGTIFVGTRETGKVYALIDGDHDGTAEQIFTIASGLQQPNGVAFHKGALYVAEINRILKFEDIEDHLSSPPRPVVVNDSFPTEQRHGWKFIRFGPDGLLYIPVGAPCNSCLSDDIRFATIMRMNPSGRGLEIFARGVRNTVGFDWHPTTHELWFTDNGRDWLGNNSPPDELNRAPRPNLHFGFPFRHGTTLSDPTYGKNMPKLQFIAPEQELGPHVAALGMRFYTGKMFPAEYHKAIFIAEHGSWNRSDPIGYRITIVKLKNNKPISYEVFAEGWLNEGNAWGRPVDLEVMADGSLLVSDDKAGAIYRITYQK